MGPLITRRGSLVRSVARSFDRAALHREFNQSVIEFYQRNL